MKCLQIIAATLAIAGHAAYANPHRRAVDEACLAGKPCTLNYAPVCGSDGKTYPNECVLKANVDCGADDLKVASPGECPSEDCPPKICTADYRPVCGSDGKTYGNLCGLEAAQCENPDLKKASDGECPEKNDECPQACILLYKPICGSDGKTYGNECELRVAACKNPDLKLKKASDGECGPKCPISICPAIYAPVCGSDGKTYDNKCLLDSAACNDASIKLAKQGPCDGEGPATACPRPGNVKYWTGKPYSAPGGQTAVQLAASWDAPAGPKRYLICYEVEQADKKIRESCFQYELPNGKGGKITWDTAAAIYAKGDDAPRIRALSVEAAENDDTGCITIGEKTTGSFKVTCGAANAKERNPVKSVSLEEKDRSANGEIQLVVEVDTNSAAAKGVRSWEKCTNRVRAKDGLVRRFCSYLKANGKGDDFTTTIKGLATRNTKSFYADVKAVGRCAPPVVSNEVKA